MPPIPSAPLLPPASSSHQSKPFPFPQLFLFSCMCAPLCLCGGVHMHVHLEVDVFLASSAPYPVSQVSLKHMALTGLTRQLAALGTPCILFSSLELQADLHSHAALRRRSKDLNPGPYATWQGLSALSKFRPTTYFCYCSCHWGMSEYTLSPSQLHLPPPRLPLFSLLSSIAFHCSLSPGANCLLHSTCVFMEHHGILEKATEWGNPFLEPEENTGSYGVSQLS